MLCGVLVLGDRPGAVAWLGIAVTVPALWFAPGGQNVLGLALPGERVSPAR
ncbi:hypothetical protein ABTZ58_31580 [Streptomyces sp. NPDC094143]|uniref:hypothetical protein n=1 Tax=Streptomyces sp. NPDC094143 TaxID=3155310 RepID=UPI003323B81F